MFLLVREIDNEQIIIGTALRKTSGGKDVTVYEISDEEYSSDMVYSRLDSFDEDN